MSDKTRLQRQILLTWYRRPQATDQQIADRVDCSPSYVSEVTSRFDDYGDLEATIDTAAEDVDRTMDVVEKDMAASDELLDG